MRVHTYVYFAAQWLWGRVRTCFQRCDYTASTPPRTSRLAYYSDDVLSHRTLPSDKVTRPASKKKVNLKSHSPFVWLDKMQKVVECLRRTIKVALPVGTLPSDRSTGAPLATKSSTAWPLRSFKAGMQETTIIIMAQSVYYLRMMNESYIAI